jgi:hypothetical protein
MDEVVVPFIGLGKERRGREGGRWSPMAQWSTIKVIGYE